MGEDYTSQSRSEFDCYNPHLYMYYDGILEDDTDLLSDYYRRKL